MWPILFNITVDPLVVLKVRAKEDCQVGRLIPHLVNGGVSILPYAYDAIIFMENNLESAVNMKLILCILGQLLGLKMNFHKSELISFGRPKEEDHHYKHFFAHEVGKLPFWFLGIPIHFQKLINKEWTCIEDRFEKKLGCWKGKLTFYGGRLIRQLSTNHPTSFHGLIP